MKSIAVLLMFTVFSLTLFAQNKSVFDMKSELRSSVNHVLLSKSYSEVSLLRGGYFTIGTTAGLSTGISDNYNQLSYGHPYAMTSFPMIFADTAWLSLSDVFNNFNQDLTKVADTLMLAFSDSTVFEGSFSIVSINNGSELEFTCKLRNIDDVAHLAGLGFNFDPALGNNGDASVLFQSGFLEKDTVIGTFDFQTLEFWERNSAPKGIGIELDFSSTQLQNLTIANWNDLLDGILTLNENLRFLYDVYVEGRYPIVNVNSGEEISFIFKINLLNPDFNDDLFCRWNFPTAMSIEENAIFPSNNNTYAEVYNQGSITYSNLNIQLNSSELLEDWTDGEAFESLPTSKKSVTVPVSAYEIFIDTIMDVNMFLYDGTEIVDQISRKVYVPASPYSETGLDIEIDTITLDAYPDIKLFFNARNSETWQIIDDLRASNLMVYEDALRIYDFSLAKDTSGGVNQADIVIILDVTGSMGDEIADVRDNVTEFADSLIANGIDVQLGMITFSDIVEDVYPLTSDMIAFQQDVAAQNAEGGGDYPENSLDALWTGCQMNFRPEANRIFIWITDATYHVNNEITDLTVNQVVDELLLHSVVVHAIAPSSIQTDWFDQIVLNTGGGFYDIYGNFRDVLLNISRMEGSSRYVVTYSSDVSTLSIHSASVVVHYQGAGGSDTGYFGGDIIEESVSCFPNPAQESVSIEVKNPENKYCRIIIRDIHGRIVKQVEAGYEEVINLQWIIGNSSESEIYPGTYIVDVIKISADNIIEKETISLVISE